MTIGLQTQSRITHAIMCVVLSLLYSVCIPTPAIAETLGVFGDWSAFKTTEEGKDVCYIGAVPSKSEGDYSSRGDTFMQVTHRPAIDELNVVSIRAGYKYKENSDVTVSIDQQDHIMFALGEMAWTKNVDEDRTLVINMRKGHKMIIHGTSWRGTLTTDTYSLKGFTRAYKTSLAACGIK